MTDSDVTGLSLTEVAKAIAARELSSVEVTRACLARIEEHDDKLNTIAGLDADAALVAASQADDDLAASNARGPLHGVPLAHKDLFFRAGELSEWGSSMMAGYRPNTTATVLTRLDAAGALDIARLNMVEFALGATGHNNDTGTPRNPWNPDYITGGSSSGSGAAVAARFVFGALGTDTGGSIRHPAYCCGLVGLKPTYGRVSRYGAMPLSLSLDHIGPLTRSVSDSALMVQAIAGFDPNDLTSSRMPVPNYLDSLGRSIKGLRIAVPKNHFQDAVDPVVRPFLDESIEVFRACGAEIVPITLPKSFELAAPLGALLLSVEGAARHSKWIRNRFGEYNAAQFNRLAPGFYYPATRYLETLNLRARVLSDFVAEVFDVADLFHAPSVPIPVPTVAESDLGDDPKFNEFVGRFTSYNRPFNYMGLPALCLPAGLDGRGLPVGFQLVGRPFDEAMLLRAGDAYEWETTWTQLAPPL
jgi:aspartyl-tRNA(Asn)/glutamyl-tRNA(Gln) amidotransferase subunit A